MIELEKSKSGVFTLKYDNKYIHSRYDPIKESIKFVKGNEELINKPVIVLYGLGLGYIVDVIEDMIDAESELYVFENNKDIVQYCKKVNNKVFEYKNVHIIYGNDKKFYSTLSECLGKVKDFIIHRPSLETIKNSNEFLYNLINDFSNMKQYKEIYKDIDIRSDENFEYNTKKEYNNIRVLIEQYRSCKKTYVIASAGPSLDYDIEILKEHRQDFIVIAVGASLKTLVNNNIYPDIVVIVDTKETIQNQFSGIDCSNISLCFDACASRWAAEKYNGSKYIFNDKSINDVAIRNGGTVAVSAIDIAVKCGAEQIVLLGQDLAFVDGKSHTELYEDMYGIKNEHREMDMLKKVKGTDGDIVYTNQGYITFRNKIEALIRANNDIKFINCSKGAFINGAEHMKFDDYILKMK